MHVVWFKRDLRVADHAPLRAAAASGAPVLPLLVVEPSGLAHPHHDPRHTAAVLQAAADLRRRTAALGSPLVVRVGEVEDVMEALHGDLVQRGSGIASLHAHAETGHLDSFGRDRAVARWARARGVALHEYPTNGVVRGLDRHGGRDAWQPLRQAQLGGLPLPPPERLAPPDGVQPGDLPTLADVCPPDSRTERQEVSESAARQVLVSFLAGTQPRYPGYEKALSSPVTAWQGCSRLSVHLAWGTLSSRQVHHAVARTRAAISGLPKAEGGRRGRSLTAFTERLAWRDHFVQRLEDSPDLEHRAIADGFDELRGDPAEPPAAAFEAWVSGNTGWPMVDASLRAVAATGWLNFRMRCLVVSVASYDLWLPWQATGEVLARWFADYEPGIHWSQMQMQSGVTGINAMRVYNPVKQQTDHDPDGVFVRRWVPELRDVPDSHLAEPWTWPASERHGYPDPRVDHTVAVRRATAVLAGVRADVRVTGEQSQVLHRHGSRRPSPARRARRGG